MSTQASGLPILIVDDDEPTQNLLRALLQRYGYASDVAFNGREAIALLRVRQYAAVILDVMMPEVGGRDVVAHLDGVTEPAPVLICSAAGPASLSGFNSRVIKAVIRKPFDIDQLIAAVVDIAGPAGG